MKLFTEIKSKQDQFYIGKGIVVMRDLCIPLSAVSSVSVIEPPGIPLLSSLVFIGFGLFFSFNDQSDFVKTVGILILLSSVIFLLIGILAAINRTSQLKIQLHSGRSVIFSSRNLSFLRELAVQIGSCISDAEITVSVDIGEQTIRHNVTLPDAESLYGDTAITSRHTDNAPDRSLEPPTHSTTDRTQPRSLTDEEWRQLEWFFQNRKRQLDAGDSRYPSCIRMEEYAGNRDSRRLKAYMKELGAPAIKSILGQTADRTIMALLTIILKSGS